MAPGPIARLASASVASVAAASPAWAAGGEPSLLTGIHNHGRRLGRWASPTMPSREQRNVAQRAERLIRELGDGAYQQAKRCEREATDLVTAEYWRRVALIVARKAESQNEG
jgi:hypothetical protein